MSCKMKCYIGIDIGGTNIKYGLLDETGLILDQGKVKTDRDNGQDIIAKIQEITVRYRADNKIIAVGVSAPGSICDDGFMITGGAINDFYGINLKEILEDKLQVPIFLENDANCAALAELWQGRAKGKRHFLTVVIGTGVGGAIVINGELFTGANFNAGEFGYMLIDPIQFGDTRRATLSLGGSVGLGVVEKYGLRTENLGLGGKQIFDLATSGDVAALGVINGFYDRLAIGLFNLSTSFDPEMILIGGAVSASDTFIKEINRRIVALQAGHKDMGSVKLPSIEACKFENDAGIIGAVYHAVTKNLVSDEE